MNNKGSGNKAPSPAPAPTRQPGRINESNRQTSIPGHGVFDHGQRGGTVTNTLPPPPPPKGK